MTVLSRRAPEVQPGSSTRKFSYPRVVPIISLTRKALLPTPWGKVLYLGPVKLGSLVYEFSDPKVFCCCPQWRVFSYPDIFLSWCRSYLTGVLCKKAPGQVIASPKLYHIIVTAWSCLPSIKDLDKFLWMIGTNIEQQHSSSNHAENRGVIHQLRL